MKTKQHAFESVAAALTAYVNRQDEAIRPALAEHFNWCMAELRPLDAEKKDNTVAE